jgi:hypothetical protein
MQVQVQVQAVRPARLQVGHAGKAPQTCIISIITATRSTTATAPQLPTLGVATLPKKACPMLVSLSSFWKAATKGRARGFCRLTCSPLREMSMSCTPLTCWGELMAACSPARPARGGGVGGGR